MSHIAIIIGSTRPQRVGEGVARWVYNVVAENKNATYELVDIRDYNLPLLDEPVSPMLGKYTKIHTVKWAAKIAQFDAYIFVTPEYNHGIPGALKNAIDFIYKEWNNKAAGFVSYGSSNGVRSVEQLRLVMAELRIADVREQVALSLETDFVNMRDFKPDPKRKQELNTMLDELLNWSEAFKKMRESLSKPVPRPAS